ncbi:MAG: alpha/beta hydrolase [Candidatus Omnitrophica bacterium]|nr:alpha/beta hydrolase [Candidatus Omnitrophota bacterium]
MRLRFRIAVICGVLFLAGCSSVPIRLSESYLTTHLYKRIPYKTEGKYRVVDIFYATSRDVKPEENTLDYFAPKIGQNTSYGYVEAKIDPRLTIGKMLPAWYKRHSVVGVQKFVPLEKETFLSSLSSVVKDSPHKSVLVLVFGYKDSFEYTAIKAAYYSYLLDINTPIVLFDWPGDQPVSIGGYSKARKYAIDSGAHLAAVLCGIIREVKPKRLWIESSSLGCQVVCSAFEQMCKDSTFADSDTEIEHVILSAPDVSDKEFNEEFKKEITALSKRITTYVSSNDEALLLTGFLDGEKKLGRETVRKIDPEQIAEAKDILYIKSLIPDKVALVDVTHVNKASYKHGYYLESPEYFDDLYLRILEEPPHKNRRLYLLKYKGDTDYWVLKGDS